MTPAIGFRLGARASDDDDDFVDEVEDTNVGQGCASLTAIPDERRFGKLALKLRRAGAVYVRVGDIEVRFAPGDKTDEKGGK